MKPSEIIKKIAEENAHEAGGLSSSYISAILIYLDRQAATLEPIEEVKEPYFNPYEGMCHSCDDTDHERYSCDCECHKPKAEKEKITTHNTCFCGHNGDACRANYKKL